MKQKNNKIFIALAFTLIIIIPFAIIGIIWIKERKCPFLIDYNTDQWATIFSGILGYLGTVTLGIVTLIQNNRATLIAKESFEKEKESYQIELNSKIPSIEIKLCEDSEKSLFEKCNASYDTIYYDKCVNMIYEGDESFVQYGCMPLTIVLKTKEIIRNFTLDKISIHRVKESDICYFKPQWIESFVMCEGDQEKTFEIRLCANLNNEKVQNIFDINADFQVELIFSLYNVLNKRMELKQSFVYFNKIFHLLGQPRIEYKEKK